MLRHCVENGQLHSVQHVVIMVDQGEVHLDALLHCRIRKVLGDLGTVGFIRNLLANRRQVVLAIDVLPMRQQLRPLARQMYPAPEQITGRAHLCRRDIRLWEHAPTQEHRNFLRIDAVVFSFPTMNGFHGERMPEDKGDPFPRTQVSQPIPREDPFDSHDKIVTIGGNDLEEGLRVGCVVLIDQELSGMAQDADVHRPGMEINPTVRFMLWGVEAHEVSSSSWLLFSTTSIPPWYAEEG